MGEDLKFRVSSGIKNIVGKDLITDDFIAVYELVKNSYDAYAKNVVITFEEDKIIIADDGKGMSLGDIKDKWLFLAYSAKKDGSEDNVSKNYSYRDHIQEKRHYAGAKGVGRFSVDRLGEELIMTTKTINSNFSEQIKVDWNLFNNQNNEFGEISVGHTTVNTYKLLFPNDSNHGLILEINKSKIWDREKILDLKHSLEKLINPFGTADSFIIKIKCLSELREDTDGKYKSGNLKGKKYYNRDKVNGDVKNAILDVLDLKTTQICVEIKNEIIETKIIDRNELIYHIKENASAFSLIKDLKIDLYYLNKSAKIQFGKLMGIQPKSFGSVMLFKNGFRIMPYGEYGDDSWGINLKSQQGYGRNLSTRELFGQVNITTDNIDEFKEVSSRDGGFVKTRGSVELFETFKIVLKRLERYVVGVLWGEGFRKKHYFGIGENAQNEVDKQRDLLKADKNHDNFDIAKNNIGSSIDFLQIIKGLSSNEDIQIIDYNRSFIENINEKRNELQPKFVTDLNSVMEQIGDEKLKNKIYLSQELFQKKLKVLEKEKEEEEKKREAEERRRKKAEEEKKEEGRRRKKAEEEKREEERRRKKAEEEKREEERRRKKAEEEKKEEERKRINAEKARQEEEKEKIIAQLAAEKKEKERYKAEVAKLEAEKKTEKEKEKRENVEKDIKHTKDQNTYLLATRNVDKETLEFTHSIKLLSISINVSLETLMTRITELNLMDKQFADNLYNIHKMNTDVMKLTKIVTKSNFKIDNIQKKVYVAKYIKEYIDVYNIAYNNKVNIELKGSSKFETRIDILNLSSVVDNLISNSVKAEAKNIYIQICDIEDSLEIIFSDDGIGLSKEFLHSPNSIFELGIRSSVEGSGLGLYSVSERMKEMYGTIEFCGNNILLEGASFKLIFD